VELEIREPAQRTETKKYYFQGQKRGKNNKLVYIPVVEYAETKI